MIIYLQAIKDEETRQRCSIKYKKFKNLVWYLINKAIKDLSIVDDIFQEVFIKYFECMDGSESDEATKKWLTVTTKSTIADYMRKTQVEKKHIVASTDDKEIINQYFEDGEEIMVEDIVKEKTAEVISEAIHTLKPIHYEVVVLRYYKDYSVKEIAYKLRCSEHTVYSRLKKANKDLRKILGYSLEEFLTERRKFNEKA